MRLVNETSKVTQMNFHAVYLLSQLTGKHMAARGQGGKIINVASLAARRAMTRFSVYGPLKAAVGQLTNSMANEFVIITSKSMLSIRGKSRTLARIELFAEAPHSLGGFTHPFLKRLLRTK